MKADTVSTLSGNDILRTAMARNQTRMNDTLKEFSTGRHADVGLALGSKTGAVLDLRHIIGDLTALTGTNGVVKGRLDNAQAALDGVRQLATGFIDTAISCARADRSRRCLPPTPNRGSARSSRCCRRPATASMSSPVPNPRSRLSTTI